MADNEVRLHHVISCNLGKLASDRVALRINFAMSAGEINQGPDKYAVFSMSHEIADGLSKALKAILDET
jgi:hypothetical protein